MEITIKENEYYQLDGLSNNLFKLKLNGTRLILMSKITNTEMMEITHVEDLQQYGFDIKIVHKICKEDIESIADENNLTVTYTKGKWYYWEDKKPNLLNNIIKEYNFYI